MIIYWITIKSSIKSKLVEGYGFFSNFVEMPQFIKYDFGAVLPTSVQYNSDERGYSNVFSFFKGGGHQGTVKTDNMTKLEETNDLLDKLIDMFDKKQQNCMGEFEKYSELNETIQFQQSTIEKLTESVGKLELQKSYLTQEKTDYEELLQKNRHNLKDLSIINREKDEKIKQEEEIIKRLTNSHPLFNK